MKLILTLLALISASTFAAAPANDSIVNAIKFTGNYGVTAEQNLSLATANALDPMINGASAGKSLWFIVPPQMFSKTLALELASSTGSGALTIYHIDDPDNPAGSLTFPTTSTFSPGSSISATESLASHSWYAVMIAGEGKFTLTHRVSSAYVPNDFPASATTITGERGTITDDNSDASLTPDEPALPAGVTSLTNSLWYRWIPAFNGQAWVDTNFSFLSGEEFYTLGSPAFAHVTAVAIYEAITPGVLTPVPSPVYTSGAVGAALAGFNASSGHIYYIEVGTVMGAKPGYFHMNYYRGDKAGEIYFAALSYEKAFMSETVGSQPIVVRRRYANPYTNASCQLSTISGGDATAGSDYSSVNATINFVAWAGGASSAPATVWEQQVAIPIINDQLPEGNESILFKLTSPSPVTATIPYNQGQITIADDDAPVSLSYYLPITTVSVKEGSGPTPIPLKRIGSVGSYVTISQLQADGSAKPDEDFNHYDTSLNAYDTEANLSPVIHDDAVFEGEESAEFQVWVGNIFVGKYRLIIEDDDPYIPVAGTLATTLDYAGGARQAPLFATMSTQGSVSGKLMLPGQALPFSGKLDTRGKLTLTLTPKGRPSFVLTLAAQTQQEEFKIELIDARTQERSFNWALLQSYTTANPCPLAGAFTLAGAGAMTIPQTCAASLKISPTGTASIVGLMFDNTAFTLAGVVDGNGEVSAGALLYGTGCVGIHGSLPLATGQVTSPIITINRPARANDPMKLGPLIVSPVSTTARYTPPAANQQALEAWLGGSGKAVLFGGGLMNSITKDLTISTKNIVAAPVNTEALKLQLIPATGMFTGSFIPPGATKPLNIFGALIDLPGENGVGGGFFFNGLAGGKISLGKP